MSCDVECVWERASWGCVGDCGVGPGGLGTSQLGPSSGSGSVSEELAALGLAALGLAALEELAVSELVASELVAKSSGWRLGERWERTLVSSSVRGRLRVGSGEALSVVGGWRVAGRLG